MPTVDVVNTEGSPVETLDLAVAVFDAPINTHCVRAAVNRQMARRRSGSASTKTRAEVRGGGTKPWPQKGLGRARAGSIRSPIWRGGGVTFGPKPRNYGGRINRRVTRSALLSCLSALARDKDLVVLDRIEFDEPRTRRMVEIIHNLRLDDGRRVLILTETTMPNVFLSARNLMLVDVVNCDNINVYDLVTHDAVVATSGAVKRLEEIYS